MPYPDYTPEEVEKFKKNNYKITIFMDDKRVVRYLREKEEERLKLKKAKKRKETITLNFESKLQDYLSFYKRNKIDLPLNFEDTIRDIWDRNQVKIEQAIKQNGFDELLIIPGNLPLTEIKDKMSMEQGYYEGPNFQEEGSFSEAIS